MNYNLQLRRLQLVELEILKKVANFCEKNSIKYSLCSGTLLGAVRHKGFIPWDDDIDICMLREDYNKFINLWNVKPVQGLIIQNHKNTPLFKQTFTKIRKDHTTILLNAQKTASYHTGIFIDIFPVDRIPKGFISKRVYWFCCAECHLLLRGFMPNDRSNFIVRLFCNLLLYVYKGKSRELKIEDLLQTITKYNDDLTLPLVFTDTTTTMKRALPSHLFEEMCFLQFEDARFMCFKDWDAELRCEFGDYMKLPPVEQRKPPHFPEVLDFEHNYDELGFDD